MLNILIHSIARAGGVELPLARDTRSRNPDGRVRALLARMMASYRRQRDRRQTYRALARLSDHALRDIGLERGMIERVADDLASRTPANDNWPARAVGSGRHRPRAAGCG